MMNTKTAGVKIKGFDVDRRECNMSFEVEDYPAEEIALNDAKEQGDYIHMKMLDKECIRSLNRLVAVFNQPIP